MLTTTAPIPVVGLFEFLRIATVFARMCDQADRATGEENQISMSPSGIEFASDAFPEPSVSQEDLLRGMEQLGMDKTSENGEQNSISCFGIKNNNFETACIELFNCVALVF